MIKEIVIVGWINRPDTYEPYLSLSRDSHSSVHSEPLMTVAQNNRIVEQKNQRIEHLESAWHADVIERKDRIIAEQERENDRLKAELDRYKRDAERTHKLLSVAICPCCDGSGGYYDSHGEPAQCQFCDEKSRALNQQQAAADWLDLAREFESVGLRYWKAADRERNKGAVKWIKNEETGFMAVVTRGEYSCELKAFCESLPFYSEQQAEVKP